MNSRKQDSPVHSLEDWGRAFRITPDLSLFDSAVEELRRYLSWPESQVRDSLSAAKTRLADDWRAAGIDATDQEQLDDFYRRNQMQLFELMEWHANQPENAGRRYISALAAAQELVPNGRRYLDFGSGIGTGAILFRQAGYSVTMADISRPLLDYCRWRFRSRALDGDLIDLTAGELPRETFDVITCFDVLEHMAEPEVAVNRMWSALRPGGCLALRVSYVDNDDHVMHIIHDPLMPYRLEPLGFRYHFGIAPPHLQLLTKDERKRGEAPNSRTLATGAKQTARAAFYLADYGTARKYFLKSLRYKPLQPGLFRYLAASFLPPALTNRLRTARRRVRSITRGAEV